MVIELEDWVVRGDGHAFAEQILALQSIHWVKHIGCAWILCGFVSHVRN
jgi:hypothetical protein